MSNISEAALRYAAYGLAVFPIHANSKSPCTEHGFYDASTDPVVIKEWWTKWPNANIAIATGSRSGGLVVVDLDVKGDHNGIEEYAKWVDDNWASMPATCMSRTWSGGRHVLYRATKPIGGRVGWLPGVDIRADGGYIIAPPSMINGEPYEWEVSPDDMDIVSEDQDEWVEFLLNDIRDGSGGPSANEPFKVPEQIKEGGRNDMLYKFACSMQAKGASDEAIRAAVDAENKAKCDPPLPDYEIRKLVNSALTKQKGETTQTKEAAQEAQDPQHLNKKLDFDIMDPFSVKELMELDIPEPVRYVGVDAEIPLLSEGSCVLAAKAKAGKSWFCTNLCWALTTGADFLGFKTKQCKVQYYDLEQGQSIEKKRIRMVSEALDEPYPEGFFIRTKLQRIGHGLEEQLEADMQKNPDIGVFIIDVFEKVRTDKKQTETDYSYTYRDFNIINAFAEKYHVAVILLFHSRKMIDPTDPFADILGSTAIQGASNQMIVLTKDKYNAKNTKLIAKGRTMDGIIEMEYLLERGVCRTVEPEKKVEDEDLDEFMNSEIRDVVVRFMRTTSYWKGKCSGLIMDCARAGIGMDANALSIGRFLGRHAGKFMKYDGILVETINNGSGGKTYVLRNTTVDTVDEWTRNVDENPFNPA